MVVRVALVAALVARCLAEDAHAAQAIEAHTRLILDALHEHPITSVLVGQPLGLLTQYVPIEQAVALLCVVTLAATYLIPKVLSRLLAPTTDAPKTLVPTIRAAALDAEARRPNAYPPNCPVATARHGTTTVVAYDAGKKAYAVETSTHERVTVASDDVVTATVQDLYVYPIKSCKGLRLASAAVLPHGLQCDRQWMFMDAKGTFLSQRKHPKMALIAPEVDVTNAEALTLTAPGMPSLRVPVLRSGVEHRVRVWKDYMLGVDQGDAAAQWAATFLGLPDIRLVRFKDGFHRQCDEAFAPDHATAFADGFPVLIACQASIDAMSAAAKHPVEMARFRPNIVMTGAPAFADDVWDCFEIGSVRFQNVKPCSRCSMPSVNQATGEKDEAGAALQSALLASRNGAQLAFLKKRANDVFFGSNVVTLHGASLAVGDRLKVLTLLQ
ncbi:hypothetical protein, variant [Saprolegnia diclina VS20]|uniref:MOSC domain-containing protein n=1 Tax=Saprolegnia diclina (strain VS20) TaxID=1156394 RepID=T0QFM1_SAPDV|nr:hypothetical protein, variant [Saprolegnia diclina VS20]EQC36749.1 hypothetical protein, variant [Saprolegnia diclina VS20]|eukprot:XP_008610169.1 hypothetical protein, variant [Saprolegnia diclina VS20]